MLTRRTLQNVPFTVNIEGIEEKMSFDVVFKNVTSETLADMMEEAMKNNDNNIKRATAIVLQAVAIKLDMEYPHTVEGLMEMEDQWPRITGCIFDKYHETRAVVLAKN